MFTDKSQSPIITYLLYDCSYMTFLKWQNCGDGHQLVTAFPDLQSGQDNRKGDRQKRKEQGDIQLQRSIQKNSLQWSKIQCYILTAVVITWIYKWGQAVYHKHTFKYTKAKAQTQMSAFKSWWKLYKICSWINYILKKSNFNFWTIN